MRVLYLDPITFPPAALDDATMLQLRRYLLGSSIVPISSCFFVDAFTLTTEQVRRELATCANRWLFLDPSGDSVTVSAVPGESVFVDGNILRDGEKRTLVHGSRITLATTASFEISYDFYETPRAATRSPVDSTRTRPDVVLDTQAGDVDVEPKEEPAISDVPMPLPESLQLQAPTTLAPVAIVTPTIAAPQDGTAPAVPKCVAAPATKRAVPLARDVSLLQTSATLAFQNTRLPDPAPWPDELPDLFNGGNDHDHDDQQDAPVAENPPRSHRGLDAIGAQAASDRRRTGATTASTNAKRPIGGIADPIGGPSNVPTTSSHGSAYSDDPIRVDVGASDITTGTHAPTLGSSGINARAQVAADPVLVHRETLSQNRYV
ncbi:hypothetical protein SPRG_15061 [Saprolegnia parasitica CBS 223.65]|uniref:FHA domain-containing protein n=1 Tax=Saprolegnia parasitica (strain CBS 223.65) TaxID=695850 RepID=A0A067BZL1_SAPPC|nr:hypothetical protein SPRG_15061 [Saprolegnia parasitica CBS 223.65]KDO19731.1 hypothetical protein SPRG_15061 [Saprolegnia parasitica CBS 223.65]|eukprot:XP_012209542.1 hypothetical protein SPRG_15061 [Saprolegnia parasitica CBS 223.65]